MKKFLHSIKDTLITAVLLILAAIIPAYIYLWLAYGI